MSTITSLAASDSGSVSRGVINTNFSNLNTDKAETTSPTFATSVTGSYLTASEMLITNGTKGIVSAPVATYPSLTELTYVKGVTSAIQTQIGNKAATDQTFYIGTTQVAIDRASAALTLAGITLTTPDIGTPSAGVLTNCTGLPAASIVPGTLATGTYLLAENASIGLDPAGSADGKYSGTTVTATAGYAQSFGDLVYIDPTDSRWEAADANATAGADGDARGILGMVVSAGTNGTACTILLQGVIRADAKFPAFTINNPIYVSETAGEVTQTQPTTTDVVIRIVGSALTADEMYFNPDNAWITHV